MSSGKAHDRSIVFMLAPVSIAAFIYMPQFIHLQIAPAIAIAGYISGGVWFSPDLDLKQSYPSQRMGIFSCLWKPYRKLSGHRGFSHIPIVGTLSRMAYLTIPAFIFAYINQYDPSKILWDNTEILKSLFIGLEISCLIHLAMDYVPGLNKH